LKILQLCPHYVPATQFGGVLRVAHALSKSLVDLGQSVEVVTTNLRDPDNFLDYEVDTPVKIDGIPVYYEPVIINKYWGLSYRLVLRCWNEIKKADIVYIHFHYQFISVIGGFICRLLKKKYIYFSHGSLNKFGIQRKNFILKSLYIKLLEKSNFQNAHFIAYHSKEEYVNSLKFGNSYIFGNGIDFSSYQDYKKEFLTEKLPMVKNKKIILYLGRIARGKGLEFFLKVFSDFLLFNNEVHFVIAGSDERNYKKELEILIKNLNLIKHVSFLGFTEGIDKTSTLYASTLFILPSYSEGLSIAMLEAMYMRVPVLVSDQVGLAETIKEKECGFVAPLVHEIWVSELSKVFQSNLLEIGDKARKLVENQFSWDIITKRLIERIENP